MIRRAALLVSALAFSTLFACAQEAKEPPVSRIAFPSPYGRLLAIETALKEKDVTINWLKAYDELARTDLKPQALKNDMGTLAFAIGVRLADGMPALMGKDAARLKACALDVKDLASRLDIKRDQLDSINPLLDATEKSDWSQVYFELGMVQQEIVTSLDGSEKQTVAAVVASGAWLQGLRYACRQIQARTEVLDLSNMLRAPAIARLLDAELAKATPEVLGQPAVIKSREILQAVMPLINVKRDENIPAEKLKEIENLAAEALKAILG